MKMAKTAVAAALVAVAVPLAACDDGTPNEDALKLPETIAGAKVSHRITTNQRGEGVSQDHDQSEGVAHQVGGGDREGARRLLLVDQCHVPQ